MCPSCIASLGCCEVMYQVWGVYCGKEAGRAFKQFGLTCLGKTELGLRCLRNHLRRSMSHAGKRGRGDMLYRNIGDDSVCLFLQLAWRSRAPVVVPSI